MRFLFVVLALGLSSDALAQTHVDPYTKKDGTYVQGHEKSKANSSTYDNYSSKPNVNPYTGEKGSKDPDKLQQQKSEKKSSYGH